MYLCECPDAHRGQKMEFYVSHLIQMLQSRAWVLQRRGCILSHWTVPLAHAHSTILNDNISVCVSGWRLGVQGPVPDISQGKRSHIRGEVGL